MKTIKRVKSVFLNGTVALVLIGTISVPAKAVTIPIQGDNPLSQIFQQFNQQLGSLRDYADKILTQKLQPLSESLGKDIDAAVSSTAGALGLPDPIKSRDDVEKIASSPPRPVYSADRAANEVDRQITRGAVASTLGEEGQQVMKQEAEATQNSVGLVEQQAQAAQGEVVTQNVMKQIALQNAQTAAVLGSMRADSLQSAQRQELTNLNLTNISRAVDGQNQAKQAEIVGAGLDTLRITSRAKLF